MQNIVIGDARFVMLGFRNEDGFVGEHDRVTRMPLPAHISARPQDLLSLIEGISAFDRGQAQSMDAVIAAAVLAFGFVYIHPFEDGNVRVLNDTGDFYRFFDATPHAEFLYTCGQKTIEEDLPQKVDFPEGIQHCMTCVKVSKGISGYDDKRVLVPVRYQGDSTEREVDYDQVCNRGPSAQQGADDCARCGAE